MKKIAQVQHKWLGDKDSGKLALLSFVVPKCDVLPRILWLYKCNIVHVFMSKYRFICKRKSWTDQDTLYYRKGTIQGYLSNNQVKTVTKYIES